MTLLQNFPAGTPALADLLGMADVDDSNEGKRITIQQAIELYNTLTATIQNKTIDGSNNTLNNLIFSWTPITMSVPQGTTASPDIQNLSTATSKVSGFVLPDGATADSINWKVVAPNRLATGGGIATVVIYYQTLAAVAGTPTVHLTLSRRFVIDGASLDVAYTAETAVDEDVPTTINTLGKVEITLSTNPQNEDFILGQLERDPTNVNDDFTGDIQIVAMFLRTLRDGN